MYPPQLNTLCDAFKNIDGASLHTDDPGNDGSNDSGITHVAVSWSSSQNGRMTALPTFEGVTGSFTHVGLWDGDVFIEARPCQMTDIVDQDITILIEHQVRSANVA